MSHKIKNFIYVEILKGNLQECSIYKLKIKNKVKKVFPGRKD